MFGTAKDNSKSFPLKFTNCEAMNKQFEDRKRKHDISYQTMKCLFFYLSEFREGIKKELRKVNELEILFDDSFNLVKHIIESYKYMENYFKFYEKSIDQLIDSNDPNQYNFLKKTEMDLYNIVKSISHPREYHYYIEFEKRLEKISKEKINGKFSFPFRLRREDLLIFCEIDDKKLGDHFFCKSYSQCSIFHTMGTTFCMKDRDFVVLSRKDFCE